MKKTLLLAAAVVAASLPCWSINVSDVFAPKTKNVSKAPHLAEQSELWLPTNVKAYNWLQGSWNLSSDHTITYDASGNVTSTTDAKGNRTDYTYDDKDRLTQMVQSGSDGAAYLKVITTYDDVLADYVTDNAVYIYEDGGWHLDDFSSLGSEYAVYKNVITRDGNGNITSIVHSGFNDTVYVETKRYTMTVGADGNVTTWLGETFDFTNGWTASFKFTDMVWDCTDGQVIAEDPTELFTGANRVKSAKYIDSDESDFKMTVTYAGDHGSYNAVLETEQESVDYKVVFAGTLTDDFGSGETSQTVYVGDKVAATKVTTEQYDANGYQTLYKLVNDGTVKDWQTWEIKYDNDKSPHPTEVLYSIYDDEAKTLCNFRKYVYSDFVNVKTITGITTVATDGATAATPEVYAISGQRVGSSLESLPAGLYIVRTGATATKVLKR